ncbi:MAG: hypothetical protein M3P26_17720 [Gemmatimonadota bacterium]|nr:hypothetical protein [Gemmatimonadota bacterium]
MAGERHRLFAQRVDERQAHKREAETKFERFLGHLSAVPGERRGATNGRYVARGGSVAAATNAAIGSTIDRHINGATAVGSVAIGAGQLDRFRGANGKLRDEIPSRELERAIDLGRTPARVRKPPIALTCRPRVPKSSCLDIVDGEKTDEVTDTPVEGSPASPDESKSPENGTTEGDGDVAATSDEVIALIHRLLKDMTSPEAAVAFGLEERDLVDATLQSRMDAVHKGIKASTLHGGPADADALFDFHHIRLAFEPVWQELFDEKLIATGKKLYEQFVAIGVDPNDYLDIAPQSGSVSLGVSVEIAKSAFKLDQSLTWIVELSPPATVLAAFDITADEWARLGKIPDSAAGIAALIEQKAVDSVTGKPDTPDATTAKTSMDDLVALLVGFSEAQKALVLLARELVTTISQDFFLQGNASWMSYKLENRRQLLRQGQRIIGYVRDHAFTGEQLDQMHELLTELAESMKQPYRFTIYAANEQERSVNFGVIATYRQRWQPGDYQAGRLVKTVPLAPKEVRRFTKKVAVKQSRAEKEVNTSLSVRKTDSSETSRAESEIVQKAHKSTNFKMSAEGGVNIGIVDAKAGSSMGQDAGTESQETKKDFHEAVFKASEEYKQERSLEVNITDSVETQTEDSGEISNPNDEITVTYLFYELQRRFRVSEQIHRLTSIVAVAQEVPTPDQISEAWIVANDWILRRVILDDSFVPAMNYLSTKVVGDEVALRELYKNVEQQRRLVEELKGDLVAIQAQVYSKYATLAGELEKHAAAVEAEQTSGGFTLLPLPVPVLPEGSNVSVEAAKERADTARADAERKERERRDVQARLDREVTTLTAITETYTKSLSEHLNRREQISRLLVHVKSNILYYMQAIWSHEVPDQRFFRLHEVQVPRLKGKKTYKLVADPGAIPGPPDWQQPMKIEMHCDLNPKLVQFDNLAEVADLDNLLGFKGNYMLFPLRRSNDVTDFLTLPYVDPFTGLRDPDPNGGWTLSEFAEYLCCLKEKVPKPELDRMLPGLIQTYQQLLTNGGNEDEIIVPTGSLFIEALPGAHPILEDFKLMHRAVDVKKVQAEVRGMEFENLRFAARLLQGEREDPTIEKKIIIEGDGTDVIVPPDA